MRHIGSLFLLLSSPLIVLAQGPDPPAGNDPPVTLPTGWWIDPVSCMSKSNGDDIKDAVERAFELVNWFANEKFTQPPRAGVNLDADEERLFKLLVANGGGGMKAWSSYRGISQIGGQNDNEDNALVKIYCDLKWLKEVEVDGQPFLQSIKGRFAVAKQKAVCTVAQAWTMASNPPTTTANVIQLCPWFADIMLIDRPKPPGQLGSFDRRWRKFREKLPSYKDEPLVDMFAGPYTTIVHELMHTSQGGEREDTGPGAFGSYGWKNVVKIGAGSNPGQNADNLMYFGLVMKLKSDSQIIIQNDGSVPTS